MKIRSVLAPFVIAAAACAAPAHASVGGPSVVACDDSLNTVFNVGYVACSGPLGGSLDAAVSFAGYGSFAFVGQTGDASGAFAADPGAALFGALELGSAQPDLFVIALDGATTHSYYLFDGRDGAIATLDFDTFGVLAANGHAGPALLHASLYTAAAAVPEPGSYALLLAGLSALGFVARRRRAL